MESEASVVARKIQNYLVIENQEEAAQEEAKQPGIFKNMLLISLMGLAVCFTQITLFLVKWTKRLEGNPK
jgi:hypothetical protein